MLTAWHSEKALALESDKWVSNPACATCCSAYRLTIQMFTVSITWNDPTSHERMFIMSCSWTIKSPPAFVSPEKPGASNLAMTLSSGSLCCEDVRTAMYHSCDPLVCRVKSGFELIVSQISSSNLVILSNPVRRDSQVWGAGPQWASRNWNSSSSYQSLWPWVNHFSTAGFSISFVIMDNFWHLL